MQSDAWSDPPFQPLTPEDPRDIGGYRILARLGAGGMGRVYLGATQTGRRLAVKVVRPELADDQEFRRRFQQEIAAAQRVQSIYTAAVVDADPNGPRPWMATAHIPGPSLAHAVAELGPLPIETVHVLVAGVAEALRAVHQAGIIHRDLKPSNVLLAPDGPRVIDFGIARATDSTPLTRTGLRIGSPQFMSPEQALGEPAGTASDVFALGSLAYFAATAGTPFGEGPDTAVLFRIAHQEPTLDGCPEPLRALVSACLTKEPSGRPSTRHIIDALTSATGATSRDWLPVSLTRRLQHYAASAALPEPQTRDTDPVQPAVQPAPSTPVRQFAFVAAGVVIVVIAIGLVLTNHHSQHSTPQANNLRARPKPAVTTSSPGGTPGPMTASAGSKPTVYAGSSATSASQPPSTALPDSPSFQAGRAKPATYPHGSPTPAPDPAAMVMSSGATVVGPGPNVDGICNAVYLAEHPGDSASPTEVAHNAVRVAWLPGQTELYTGDPQVYYARQVYAPNAAWNWTCGRPGQGLYVTWAQFTWSCQYWNPKFPTVIAHLKNPDDAYSWECVG